MLTTSTRSCWRKWPVCMKFRRALTISKRSGYQRNTTANIDIVTKKDKPGIDVIIKPGTQMSVHPVILSRGWTTV